MKKTKTSKGKTSKEKKIFEKFLTLLGFVFERVSKHGEVWKHHVKKLSTQIPTSPSASQWVHDYKRQLSKLISPAFTREEIELLLEPLIKKRKVKYTDDGRIRLLRIEPKLNMKGFPLVEGGESQEDLEEDLLYALLPPDTDTSNEDIIKEIKKNIPESLKKKIKI